MLEKISIKQKIMIVSILIILLAIGGIIFYVFIENQETEFDLEQLVDSAQNENVFNQNEENKEPETNQANEEKKEMIIVHITGEVKNTGIITLEKGARIADAIEKAGGETKEADLNEVNLAYELQDGQQIYIPNKKDKTKNEGKVYITSESGNNVIKQENINNTNKGVNKKVNINTANQSELETLPGIGESIASRIIEYREQNGKFQKIEDLQNVKGIGESKFEKIKDQVTV